MIAHAQKPGVSIYILEGPKFNFFSQIPAPQVSNSRIWYKNGPCTILGPSDKFSTQPGVILCSKVTPNGYFGGWQAPRSPRGVQVGPRWFLATGTMSHTMPQPSQLAFWVLNSQNREKSGQKWPKNRHFGVYFGGLTFPGPTMCIQMGVNWSQATGILSHTIPQLSQLALWVLNSQNREKSGPQCPQNRHFGGLTLPGPLMCIHYVRLQCFHIQGGPK